MARTGRIMGLLRESAENEIGIDDHIVANLLQGARLVRFKTLKTKRIQERLGPVNSSFWQMAAILVALYLPLAALRLFMAKLLTTGGRPAEPLAMAYCTVSANRRLVEAAAASEGTIRGIAYLRDERTLLGLVRWSDAFSAAAAALGSAALVLAGARRSKELLLHSYDSVGLAAIAACIDRRPGIPFYTDDHYQRWAFVASRLSSRVRIAQHGFVDAGIKFPNPFGSLERLFLRDESFNEAFAAYYAIGEALKYRAPLAKSSIDSGGRTVLLLASSLPHFEEELRALRDTRRTNPGVFVAVKFHPHHEYGDRRGELAALSDYICGDGEYIACDIFASHNSFLKYDYADEGTFVVDLAFNGVETMLDRLVAIPPRPRGERS